ncbi:MAG: class A beta-lactamase-related serine hydrolase [Actinobacteria bacterium]|nr:class A beta-lactamase-related serine hydrolase [Actinomycetota bacterium]
MWCSALVTWGLAAVAGMGLAVYAPDRLPEVGSFAAPLTQPAATGATRATTGGAGVPTKGGTGAAPTSPATTTAIDASPGARQRAADRAVYYAQAQGWRSGIAIKDLVTGEVTVAGDAEGYFRTESTVKLFIAARLLAEGRLTGATEPVARRMLTLSDDAAASSLYASVGGDGLIAWIGAHYRLSDPGTPPVRGAGQWGSTQVTPLAMVTFLAAAYHEPRVGTWLIDTMIQMEPNALDGTSQMFGLRAADSMAVVKQGWGGDSDPSDVVGTPSVGYVDRGRYAVAIYTVRLPESPIAEAQGVVTAQAKLLLPQGRMPRL